MGTKFGRKSAIYDARRAATLALSVPVGAGGGSTDADTVDGIHASASPTVNFLLALDGSALFPDSVIAATIARDTEVTAAIATHTAIDSAHHDPVTAGDGIVLSTQQVSVDLSATSGLEFSSGDLQIADAIAGNGLTISAKILAVGAGDGIDIVANSVAVDVTDLLGDGIVEQATNNLALGTPSTTTVSTSNAVTADSHTHQLDLSGRTLTAGDGLTGGGTLGSDRTFTLGTPSTLTVATSNAVTATSHTHNITASSNPGAAASLLCSNPGGYLRLVRLGIAIAPTVPLEVLGNVRFDGDLSFVGAQSIITTAGNLTLAPTADLTLTPGGNDVILTWGAGKAMSSSDYVSQTTGWGISYGSSGGHADFRSLYADELHVQAFIADIYEAHVGAIIITKSRARVSRDFTIPANTNTGTLYLEDLEGWENTQLFTVDDVVRLRYVDTSGGGLIVTDVWGVVTNYTDLTGGEQSYTFTTSDDGGESGSKIFTGAVALDYGQSGSGSQGTWEATVLDAAGAPYSQVATWATNPWTGGNWTTRVRLGNLDGISGIGLEYGLWAGQNTSDTYLLLSDSSFEVHGLDVKLYDGASNTVRLDPATPSFAMGSTLPTGYGTGEGIWMGKDTTYKFRVGDPAAERLQWDSTNGVRIYDGDNTVAFEAKPDGSVWLSSLAISEDLGQMFFSDADGLALWGPGCKITNTAWTSTRGQVATISGAFRQVPGRWPGTRGLAVEPAGTNYIINPVFGVNVTDGWANNGMTTCERSTVQAKFGAASMHLVSDATTDDMHSDTVSEADGGEDWTAVVEVYLVSGDFQVTIEENVGGGWQDKDSQAGGVVGQWQRITLSVTLTAGATDGRVKLEPESTAASEFYVGYVGFHPTAYAPTAIYGSAGTGYAWTGASDNSTSTRTATEMNLDTLAGLLSGNTAWSIALWVQMPYAWNATWPTTWNYLFTAWEHNQDRAVVYYEANAQMFRALYRENNVSVTSEYQLQFDAGDWIHLAYNINTAGNQELFVNGVLRDTDDLSARSNIQSTEMNVGGNTTGDEQSGFIFDETAVLDDVLTAAEIATLYARQRPLVDYGAVNKPGIFILDGQFDLASSLTGARVRINADGLSAFSDESGNPQSVKLDTDGDFFLGSNVAAAATTAFAVFANAQTYNSEALGAGDLLIGDNSASKANVFWDKSAGDLQLRTSTTTHIALQADGDIFIGEDVSAAATTNFAIFTTAQTYNSESVSVGDFLIGDNSANKANIFWDKSAGKLQFRGGTTMQCEIGTDGSLLAGAGNVVLDSSGVAIIEGQQNYNELRWLDTSDHLVASAFAYLTGSVVDFALRANPDLDFTAYANTFTLDVQASISSITRQTVFELHAGLTQYATLSATPSEADLRVEGGLAIGSTSVDPAAGELCFGSATYRLRRNGTHIEWHNGSNWVQLD